MIKITEILSDIPLYLFMMIVGVLCSIIFSMILWLLASPLFLVSFKILGYHPVFKGGEIPVWAWGWYLFSTIILACIFHNEKQYDASH